MGEANGAAAGTTFTVGGQTYTMRRLELLKDFQRVQEHLWSKRQDPFDAIRPQLEKYRDFPAVQQEMVRCAYRELRAVPAARRIPQEEIAAWVESPEGFTFMVHLLLRDHHPQLTAEQVADLLTRLEAEQYAKVRQRVLNPDEARELLDSVAPEG